MIDADNQLQPPTLSFRQCLQGTWQDWLLLILMVLSIVFLWLSIEESLSQGPPTAYVYHGKQLLAKYPLPTDNQVIHMAAQGEIGVSDIEISSAGIRFISSPCTTHYCTLGGQKSYTGSVIACVPNHIMVVLRGSGKMKEDTMHFDAFSE